MPGPTSIPCRNTADLSLASHPHGCRSRTTSTVRAPDNSCLNSWVSTHCQCHTNDTCMSETLTVEPAGVMFSPNAHPVPGKLANQIREGGYVKMEDLLPENTVRSTPGVQKRQGQGQHHYQVTTSVGGVLPNIYISQWWQ